MKKNDMELKRHHYDVTDVDIFKVFHHTKHDVRYI